MKKAPLTLVKKVALLLIICLASIGINAQSSETCETPGDVVEDLNSITKCTIKKTKKGGDKNNRQISVRISAPKRFFKKRKQEAIDGPSASTVSNTDHTSEMNQAIILKTNVAALSNNLSREEVKKAEKFSTIDNLPSFTACEGSKKKKQLDCFNVEMIKHIQKHFTYPNEAMLNKIQGEVWVRFIIDMDGNVTNIKTLGPKGGKLLNDEAVRVVSNLPKFIPAVKSNKTVSVKYGFPINFSLEEI